MAARDEILSASAGVKNFAAAKLEERQTEPEQSETAPAETTENLEQVVLHPIHEFIAVISTWRCGPSMEVRAPSSLFVHPSIDECLGEEVRARQCIQTEYITHAKVQRIDNLICAQWGEPCAPKGDGKIVTQQVLFARSMSQSVRPVCKACSRTATKGSYCHCGHPRIVLPADTVMFGSTDDQSVQATLPPHSQWVHGRDLEVQFHDSCGWKCLWNRRQPSRATWSALMAL
ncbi:hypothetical protein AAP_03605 [Ascosphaera apis ARSEF 7405]|uniref:Uncharacterized protein n=1 Tax=Ascosphaera apis ARSEF 7405 TaxID=392613 RepID=A0A167Y7U5_9EURO|nr:hypothetical protein AAP_03605 [Ascosphaera apis ARSEF 7405]